MCLELLHVSDISIKVSFYFVSGGSSLASVVAGSKPTRSWDKPHFDDIAPRNVTAIVGQTAELNCHVKHPGDRVVSNIFMLHLPHNHCFSRVCWMKDPRKFPSEMHRFFSISPLVHCLSVSVSNETVIMILSYNRVIYVSRTKLHNYLA